MPRDLRQCTRHESSLWKVKREKETNAEVPFPLSREPMSTSWQCPVIFIISSKDLRLEEFLKLNKDLEKFCVLNQQGWWGGGGGWRRVALKWELAWTPPQFESSNLWIDTEGSKKNPTQDLSFTSLAFPYSFIDINSFIPWLLQGLTWLVPWDTSQQLVVKHYKSNLQNRRPPGGYSSASNKGIEPASTGLSSHL